MSKYGERLLAHMEAHKDFVLPEVRYNEVASFVKGGLRDLTISRTSFRWGIPVSRKEKHVIYVWFDALTNYITGVGFLEEMDLVQQILALRRAPDRQGYPAVPCRVLAELPHVRRHRARRSRSLPTAGGRSRGRRCPSPWETW